MSVNFRTIKDIRKLFISELKGIYPENEITAISTIVLKTQTGIDRLHLLMDPGQVIPAESVERITAICHELKTGKPIQYILGETLFYNCIIKVDSSTLIPRPETEELVDLVIRENPLCRGKIIDFGTGSGCIAIAVKKNLPEATVTGIDISEKAIETAVANAILNNVPVTFIKADLLNFKIREDLKADIILSNPPYVLNSEKKNMGSNVLKFEPHQALFVPDNDPLLFYREILKLSEKILLPDGRIYFEINEKMGSEMEKLLLSYRYSGIKIIKDINGKNRIIKTWKNG
jgi:release factor glutamine methyltransferase